MRGNKWTDDMMIDLLAGTRSTYGEIANAMNIEFDTSLTGEAVRSRAREKRSTQSVFKYEGKAVITNKVIEAPDYKDVWKAAIKMREAIMSKHTEQCEATVEINIDDWFAMCFPSDLHLGNIQTDYDAILRDRELILSHPNIFVSIVGDLVDNYIGSAPSGGDMEALLPPQMQRDMAVDYITGLSPRLLGVVRGCHEHWSWKIDDFDIIKYLAKQGDTVNLGDGGTLFLKTKDVEYKVMMRHKYRYNSGDNACATVKKMFEKEGQFDVGVIAHHHDSHIEMGKKQGMDGDLERVFVRCGSYKLADRYGKKLGYTGEKGMPIVVFNAKEREIYGFEDIHKGIDFLDFKLHKSKTKPKGKKRATVGSGKITKRQIQKAIREVSVTNKKKTKKTAKKKVRKRS